MHSTWPAYIYVPEIQIVINYGLDDNRVGPLSVVVFCRVFRWANNVYGNPQRSLKPFTMSQNSLSLGVLIHFGSIWVEIIPQILFSYFCFLYDHK